MSEGDAVRYEVSEGVARVVIDRPDRRNALSGAVIDGLVGAFERARSEPAVRVVVLTGAGDRAFCAGGDLGSAPPPDLLGRRRAQGRYAELLASMLGDGPPTIARVGGHALGGGIGLVMACDLAIARRGARLGTPEIDVGLFPMMVMALLTRHVGRKRALEMVYTGEKLSAETAFELGLLTRVVDDEDLDTAVEELAGRIASKSPAVLRLGRQAFHETADLAIADALPRLRDYLALNTMLEDAAEGIMAFIQKREPEWKGR